MTELIVYVDESTIREGRFAELQEAMAELVDFIDAYDPDILAYNVNFGADDSRMTVVHLPEDSDSLATHMEVAGPKFPPIGEFIDLESIDVYGRPDEELVRRLREKAAMLGDGRVTIHDRHLGADRIGTG